MALRFSSIFADNSSNSASSSSPLMGLDRYWATPSLIASWAALLINSLLRTKGLFQTLYFLPYVTSTLAIGLVFRWLFHSEYGYINFFLEFLPIIKGDAKSISIGAASIVAKVTRDRLMVEYDKIMPGYGFAANKGYGSAEHIAALKKYGPTPIHRRSFIGNFVEV